MKKSSACHTILAQSYWEKYKLLISDFLLMLKKKLVVYNILVFSLTLFSVLYI